MFLSSTEAVLRIPATKVTLDSSATVISVPNFALIYMLVPKNL